MTTIAPDPCRYKEKEEPKLRHEFVGMMFALAAGEVALQVASLLQQPVPWTALLPAYAHLSLTIVVIAASWVGWTLSPSPGAHKDVVHVVGTGFGVLLIDVALVICYFVLARAVDFHAGECGRVPEYHPSAQPEVTWIWRIFWLYLLWDFWTKVVVYLGDKLMERTDERWYPKYLVRFFPTIFCIGFAYLAKISLLDGLSPARVVLADATLLILVLLFRALKDVTSAFWPNKEKSSKLRKWISIVLFVSLLFIFLSLLWWTKYGPIDWLESKIGVYVGPRGG